MVGSTLIVGIGSPHGDDQVGWQLAERLADALSYESLPREIEVRLARSPAKLSDWLAGVTQLIVCDACRGLGQPGGWRRFDWPTDDLAPLRATGSHDLTLPDVLQLADQLGRLPPDVVIWAIEAKAAVPNQPLSPEVAAAIPRVLEQILADFVADQRNEPPPAVAERSGI
jgi:hydrogenase maturation protease